MAAYFLSELRRENITKRKRVDSASLVAMLPVIKGARKSMFE